MGALSGRIVFVPLPLLYMQCVQNSASLGSPTGMGQFLSRALRLAQVQVLLSLTSECIVCTMYMNVVSLSNLIFIGQILKAFASIYLTNQVVS